MYSNLEVTGTTAFNGGTLTLGDNASDNVVFGADVNSHIIPNTDDTYDLGSSTQEWRNLYIDGTANIDALVADLVNIQKEIYFGKTSLPLYKVYGSSEGHSYEYLGTAADFQSKKEGEIKNKGEMHYPCLLYTSPSPRD